MASRSSGDETASGRKSELPPKTKERIETERRRLQQAVAVLAALAIAIDEDPESFDAGDVALAAKALVETAIENLDSVSLQQA